MDNDLLETCFKSLANESRGANLHESAWKPPSLSLYWSFYGLFIQMGCTKSVFVCP